MALPLPTYADVQDYEDYVEGWETTDEDGLNRLLYRAQMDVNTLLTGPADHTTGLRVDPATELTVHQANALARAVCAQAEYRNRMGESFFRENEPSSITGPDFSRSGRFGKIGDKVYAELRDGGLLVRGTFLIT
jgi:hypothetical protein